MKYLTKTEFKTAVDDLERSRGGWRNKVKLCSGDKCGTFVEMEPGMIYLRTNQDHIKERGWQHTYMTLMESYENEKWVEIFDPNDLKSWYDMHLHLQPHLIAIGTFVHPDCSYYMYALGTAQGGSVPYVSEEEDVLTFNDDEGDIKFNGYNSESSLTFYSYEPSMTFQFMNWLENPFN
tara:strand:+ start:382 stop:915 length:534 start_codon:yes stop_codon:yes gene_type:complete